LNKGEAILAKYKLKFWFEWGADTAFQTANDAARDQFGYIFQPELLPLSPETIERIHYFSEWHDTSLNWGYPPDPGPWRQEECDRFNKAATDLFEAVVRELGDDFEVVNTQGWLVEDPDLDAYLKDPHGFKR